MSLFLGNGGQQKDQLCGTVSAYDVNLYEVYQTVLAIGAVRTMQVLSDHRPQETSTLSFRLADIA